MDRGRALKLLLRVRERRTAGMQDAVEAALVLQQEAVAVKRAAEQAVTDALAAEAMERDRLARLTSAGQTFDVDTLFQREHAATFRKGVVVERQQDVERSEGVLRQRQDDVRARRSELARHRQKLDALGADIARLQALRQQEDDDCQDEEAEETSVSRLLAARKSDDDRGAVS